ncbi:MAG TPA: hypothetical protein VNT29_06775 [Candidatus Limnocylindrales bacterium]|nr:hypothetical protein [Candidatus Limnocylindrales bacterium]
MEPIKIPIEAAKRIADEYDQAQVILLTYCRRTDTTSVVTYGRNAEDKEQAADGGNFVKKALGWPEELCHDRPAAVPLCRVCRLPDFECRSWGKDTESHRAPSCLCCRDGEGTHLENPDRPGCICVEGCPNA